MTHDAITFEISSGNVFADIGLPDADDMLIKAHILVVLQRLIKAEKLTQVAAARRLGIAQPDLSSLLRGRVRGYSIERLMRLLTRFGQDVEIVIRPQADAAGTGRIRVAA